MLQEASKCRKNFCLSVDINGELKLKKKHVFFYQVQGQMQAYDRKWCDFLVRRTNPYDLHVERIVRDDQLWGNEMLPKLTNFYFGALLPELSVPRKGKYPGIRKTLDVSLQQCF
jgi:hypothetical protein